MRIIIIALTAFLLGPVGICAASDNDPEPAHTSIGLTVDNYGLSIGNSRRINGLRINLSDIHLEQVNGVNLTLWRPRKNPGAVINGLAVGVLAPEANCIHGVSVGGLACVGASNITGIGLGGLAVVGGDLTGVMIGGLATVAELDVTGLALGGLAVVAERGVTGLAVGGLAVVAERQISGITAGGLAVVSEQGIVGCSIAGLATVAEGDITGINIGGLAVVANENITGLTVTPGGVYAGNMLTGIAVGVLPVFGKLGPEARQRVSGISAAQATGVTVHAVDIAVEQQLTGAGIGGLRVKAEMIEGLALAGLLNTTKNLTGAGIGTVNYVHHRQTGLTIGVFNHAGTLNGVQLGLLNFAGNNKGVFKLLPVLNAHF